MSMKSDSLNGAIIPLFCIYKQRWDVGGVSGLSTNRKHEGITSEAHSMHPAKGDCPSQSCWKACVSVWDRKGVRRACDVSKVGCVVCMYMLISAGVTEHSRKNDMIIRTTQSDLLSTDCLDMARSLLRTWASSWIHSVWRSVDKPELSQLHHLSEKSGSFWHSSSFLFSSKYTCDVMTITTKNLYLIFENTER